MRPGKSGKSTRDAASEQRFLPQAGIEFPQPGTRSETVAQPSLEHAKAWKLRCEEVATAATPWTAVADRPLFHSLFVKLTNLSPSKRYTPAIVPSPTLPLLSSRILMTSPSPRPCGVERNWNVSPS